MHPENGVSTDGWNSTLYAIGPHPSDEGNRLLGEHIARNFIARTKVYYGTGISQTINTAGLIKNSRDIYSRDIRIPFAATPNTGSINVSITSWTTTGNCNKVWNESSTTAASTRHIIGDFPANAPIQVLRDGANYAVMTSNSTGYIDWTYSGGYSEHTFEATAGSPVTLTVTSLNALKSSSEAATNMTLSAETQYTGTGALYNSVRDTISSGYTLASLIVLVIGAFALFRYMGYM